MVEQMIQMRPQTLSRPQLDTDTLHYLGEFLTTRSETRQISYAEFLAWADEDTLAEWVNGEIIMTSPASSQHQQIADFLGIILGIYIKSRELGLLLSAPFQMKLEHGREPDLLFIKRAHLDRLKRTYLDGPADLVVEIIGRDRGDKFYEYAAGGVPEYWLIDPLTQRAEFYQLQHNYYQHIVSGETGRYESLVLPGFWLNIEWLWQDPRPSSIRILAEIVGMDAEIVVAFEQALRGAANDTNC